MTGPDYGAERGRAFRRAVLIAILLGAWSVRAGWAPMPRLVLPEKKPAPGRPARVSAKVSWRTTP
jgi:hypothetical protein